MQHPALPPPAPPPTPAAPILDYRRPPANRRRPFYGLLHPALWLILAISLLIAATAVVANTPILGLHLTRALILICLVLAYLCALCGCFSAHYFESADGTWRDVILFFCGVANFLVLILCNLAIVFLLAPKGL